MFISSFISCGNINLVNPLSAMLQGRMKMFICGNKSLMTKSTRL